MPHCAAVWVTLALIAVSAACGAVTDLSFNMTGYLWQIVNCAFTAGYSLSLRGAMDKVSRPTLTSALNPSHNPDPTPNPNVTPRVHPRRDVSGQADHGGTDAGSHCQLSQRHVVP